MTNKPITENLTPEEVAELLLSDPANVSPFKKAYKASLNGEDCFKDFIDRFMDEYDVELKKTEVVLAAIWQLAAEDAISQCPTVRAIEHESQGIVYKVFKQLSDMVDKAWKRYTLTDRQPVAEMIGTKPDGVSEHIDYHALAMQMINAGSEAQIGRLLTGVSTDDRRWFLHRLLNEVMTKVIHNTGVCVWLASNMDVMGYVDDAVSMFQKYVFIEETEAQRRTAQISKLMIGATNAPTPSEVDGTFDAIFDLDDID